MNKDKSICWITGGYLLQVDLPVLSSLKDFYDIHWVVLAPIDSTMARTAKEYADKYNIELEVHSARGHRYLPLGLIDYYPLCKHLADLHADIYYCNWTPFPYAWIPFEHFIPTDKLIMAMHHGTLHDGMQLKHIYKYYLRHVCNRNVKFHYFSESQANGNYSANNKNNITVIPLALNDYGTSEEQTPKDYIEFLSFGHIIETKNIGLLINAANKLFEKTKKKFKVKIVGQCRVWDKVYQPLIKYPEIFDLDVRMVPDDMIPNLFSSSHYLILPYKAVTQSGPLRIAYGYNTPVIASDLEGFRESVVQDVTGLMFHTEDVDSLVNVMLRCLEGGEIYYQSIKEKQRKYISDNYSICSIVNKYKRMFDSL